MELEKIIVHDDYNPETVQHDIALLKLKQPVDLAVRGEEILHFCTFTYVSRWVHLIDFLHKGKQFASGAHSSVHAKIRGEIC